MLSTIEQGLLKSHMIKKSLDAKYPVPNVPQEKSYLGTEEEKSKQNSIAAYTIWISNKQVYK